MLSKLGKIWTIGSAAVNAGNSSGTVGKIQRMHAVDADQQDISDTMIAAVIIRFSGGGARGCKTQHQSHHSYG
jgi:hypothetical protein